MSHFFAILSRMKFIRRWSLMRNTIEENVQEHTLQTAMIAYHLCLLHNRYYADGGTVDAGRAVLKCLPVICRRRSSISARSCAGPTAK